MVWYGQKRQALCPKTPPAAKYPQVSVSQRRLMYCSSGRYSLL